MIRRAPAALALLLLAATSACGADEPDTPPQVTVRAGPQEVPVPASQYCLDGEGQRYGTRPPIVEVSPGTTIRLEVPESVAERGWSVQVFDDQLVEQLGEVDVPAGSTVYDGINSSDVVPAAYHLVVVEDSGEECSGLSGAWPVGFLRAGGDTGGTATPAG
ncbi:DUF2771 family protein [Geodermatophilus sp. SYSU D00758]